MLDLIRWDLVATQLAAWLSLAVAVGICLGLYEAAVRISRWWKGGRK